MGWPEQFGVSAVVDYVPRSCGLHEALAAVAEIRVAAELVSSAVVVHAKKALHTHSFVGAVAPAGNACSCKPLEVQCTAWQAQRTSREHLGHADRQKTTNRMRGRLVRVVIFEQHQCEYTTRNDVRDHLDVHSY